MNEWPLIVNPSLVTVVMTAAVIIGWISVSHLLGSRYSEDVVSVAVVSYKSAVRRSPTSTTSITRWHSRHSMPIPLLLPTSEGNYACLRITSHLLCS